MGHRSPGLYDILRFVFPCLFLPKKMDPLNAVHDTLVANAMDGDDAEGQSRCA